MQDYTFTNIKNVVLIGEHLSGKTTLAESLLYVSGQIPKKGSVEKGNTVMDFDPEEIKRKMSIKLSVAFLEWKGYKINLIDTPGLLDFVGDIISGLHVAENAILVVDGTRGVTLETEKIWHLVDSYDLPRAIFVNKYDQENVIPFEELLNQFKEKFGKYVIPLEIPIGKGKDYHSNIDLIHQKLVIVSEGKREFKDIPEEYKAISEKYREMIFDDISEVDETFMEKYLGGEEIKVEEVVKGFREAIYDKKIIPVFFGSAKEDIGTYILLEIIEEGFAAVDINKEKKAIIPEGNKEVIIKISPEEYFTGFVFKTYIDPYIGKMSYVKVISGVLYPDKEVLVVNKKVKERIQHIFIPKGKELLEVPRINTGDIFVLTKIDSLSTNNTITDPQISVVFPPIQYPSPIHFVALIPKDPHQSDKLAEILHKFMEQDPSFIVRFNPIFEELEVHCQGQQQLETYLDILKEKYKIEVNVETPKVEYRETITKQAIGHYKLKKQHGGRGQYAEVYLRVEPLPRGAGFKFQDEIKGGVVPKQFIPSVEKGVREALEEGILAGYPVVDVSVTLFDGTFHEVDSSDIAFKIASWHAMKQALQEANSILLEPIMNVRVYVDEQYMGAVLEDLNARRGKVMNMETKGGTVTIYAQVPLAEMLRFNSALNSITKGLGRFEMEFDHYEPVPQKDVETIIQKTKELKEKIKERKEKMH